MSAVEIINLEKRFESRRRRRRGRDEPDKPPALGGVSLEIARGECLAILGQNGSGKSTLVRILSTLLLPDGGEARVFGHDVVREAQAVRTVVNRVSVEASFFKKMSADENLAYAARFYGLTPRSTRSRIPEILGRVGFPTTRSGEPMEKLSRGMQQKVALARALLTSPTLLLLDEPTTGLDPRSKREVQAFITEMRAVHDTTILLCTHDLAEADALAERTGILHEGRLLGARHQPGDPRALRGRGPRGGVLHRDRRGDRRRDPRTRRWRHECAARTDDRARRSRRAQRLPDQALRLVGADVLRLHLRQHADGRVHRQGGAGGRRASERHRGRRRRCWSGRSSGPTSGSSSRSSPRRSRGSGGRGRSSTRSWRRCRGSSISAAWASSPCSTGCCGPRCCSW